MLHRHLMNDADRDELAQIEAAVVDAKARRVRLMARLRQRAHRKGKQRNG